MQERKTKKYTDSEERIRHRQSELSGLEEGNSNKLRLQASKLQQLELVKLSGTIEGFQHWEQTLDCNLQSGKQ